MAKTTQPKTERTTQGLRDILFDEIERIRTPEGDPQRALSVANLAKQIINTAKVELDFHRTMATLEEQGTSVNLGTLKLGSN